MAGWWGPSHCTRSWLGPLIFVKVRCSLFCCFPFCCWVSFTVPLDLRRISRRCGKKTVPGQIKTRTRWEIYTADILSNSNSRKRIFQSADGESGAGNHEAINRMWPNFVWIFDFHLGIELSLDPRKIELPADLVGRCTKQRDERKLAQDWMIIASIEKPIERVWSLQVSGARSIGWVLSLLTARWAESK